jgi:hypothetical protein
MIPTRPAGGEDVQLLAVPRAADVTPSARVLRAAARVPTVVTALHAVVPVIAEATPAVEILVIAPAAALQDGPVRPKAPVATGVATQAPAELVRAPDVAPEIARPAQLGQAAEPRPIHQAIHLVLNAPASEIARALQFASRASTKAMRDVARAPAARSAVRDLVLAKAVLRVDRVEALAMKAPMCDAHVVKAMRRVARALAVRNAGHDLVSAKALVRVDRAEGLALAARNVGRELVLAEVATRADRGADPARVLSFAVRELVRAQAAKKGRHVLLSARVATRAGRAEALAVKVPMRVVLVAKAMRRVVLARGAVRRGKVGLPCGTRRQVGGRRGRKVVRGRKAVRLVESRR